MSWLIRNGTGRNNIIWGGGNTTSGNYLRRTGTSRNNISYVQISSNGTWNILERTSTGRNNIRWNNLTFNFFSFSNYPLYDSTTCIHIAIGKGARKDNMYKLISYLNDGYQVSFNYYGEEDNQYFDDIHYYVSVTFSKSSALADKFINAFKSAGYSKIKLSTNNSSITLNIGSSFAGKIWTTTKQGVFNIGNDPDYIDFVEDKYDRIIRIQFL